jgi:hypothetical protein
MIVDEANKLADYLSGMPRHQKDLDAAIMLRLLARVYQVAKEMLDAKTIDTSMAAHDELIDLIKGKPDS